MYEDVKIACVATVDLDDLAIVFFLIKKSPSETWGSVVSAYYKSATTLSRGAESIYIVQVGTICYVSHQILEPVLLISR